MSYVGIDSCSQDVLTPDFFLTTTISFTASLYSYSPKVYLTCEMVCLQGQKYKREHLLKYHREQQTCENFN